MSSVGTPVALGAPPHNDDAKQHAGRVYICAHRACVHE